MREIPLYSKSSIASNQAGKASVAYVLAAVLIGAAGVSSFDHLGGAADRAIAHKTVGAAGGAIGGGALAGMDGETSVGYAPGDDIIYTTAGPVVVGQEPATQHISAAAEQSDGARGFGLTTLMKLGLGGAMGYWAVGAAVAGSPFLAVFYAAGAAVWALSSWNDIHAPSFGAVASGIGKVTGWIADSFVGDAIGAVHNVFAGNHFFGNTFSGVVGSAWHAIGTVVNAAFTIPAAIVDPLFNVAETIGYGIYDVTGIDSLFFSEFSDYSGLWNFPLTSFFAENTAYTAGKTWDYLRRIGRFNRPGMAKRIAVSGEGRPVVDEPADDTTGGTEESAAQEPSIDDTDFDPQLDLPEFVYQAQPLEGAESIDWPFELEAGQTLAGGVGEIFSALGLGGSELVRESRQVMFFTNDDGSTDVLELYMRGSEEAGHYIEITQPVEGSDEPLPILMMVSDPTTQTVVLQAGADDEPVEQLLSKEQYANFQAQWPALAVRAAGLEFENITGSLTEESVGFEKDDGSFTYATFTVFDGDLSNGSADSFMQVDAYELDSEGGVRQSIWDLSPGEGPNADSLAVRIRGARAFRANVGFDEGIAPNE